MERNVFYTVSNWLGEYHFLDSVVLNSETLENIFLDKLQFEEDGDETRLACTILMGKSFEVSLPNINDIGFLVGDNEEAMTARLGIVLTPDYEIRLSEVSAKLFVSSNLLLPAKLIGPNKFEPDLSLQRQTLDIGKLSMSVSASGRIHFAFDNDVSIPPSYLGNSGIIIELKHLSIPDLDVNNIEISVGEANVILPDFFLIPAGTALTLSNATINNRGFSGNCSISIPLRYDDAQKKFFAGDAEASVFGIPGGLKHLEVVVENNQPTTLHLEGQLLVPYFNVPIDVVFSIGSHNCVSVSLKGMNGQPVSVTKEALVTLYLQSLEIDCANQSLTITGGLEPLLFSSEGMKWPRMDVRNLRIDTNGKISIEEAWLDLKDMATLDLFGFYMELRKIGIGTIEEAVPKLWVDLSGGVKLIEQVPIGIDVEGFRIIWPQQLENVTPQTISSNVGIQFKGVQLSFGVPGALQIDGLIRFFKDANATGFAGDMVLVIPPAGLTAEAGLLVGMNTEPDPYAFFYVYFGLESAAGIPLGQSGLALKGAIGLFGINVAPDKSPEQNWYYDWYKRAPAPGAHQTTKWTYQRDGLAVGAGVTITTVDGVVKGTKGIIVLALPGPILVINGKALVLDVMKDPAAEPPFSATAVFDGKEKIVQFNIEAQAEIVKDMIDAQAGVEAFFDFKDVTNWHCYLGQDRPEDRRIRANVLNVIEADAYLMLDMVDADSPRARMGMGISVRPKIDPIVIDIPFTDDDPEISFKAHVDIGGKGEVSMQPEQFSGSAYIDAGIEVKALAFELEISAEADLAVEGPAPFSLQASLDLDANLPDPLPDYHGEFDYKLEIPKVDLDIQDPLIDISLFNRFKSESKSVWVKNAIPDSNLPSVPYSDCDVNPVISFAHEMNQACNFVMPPSGVKTYESGLMLFKPTLQKVIIAEKKKSGGGWVDKYSTTSNTLPGVWLAESDPASPGEPSSRRVQLLTVNALANTTHSTGVQGYAFMQTEAESQHLSELILQDYPNLLKCPPAPVRAVCLEFRHSTKIEGKSIKWGGIQLQHAGDLISIASNCLNASSGVKIIFPERIVELKIEFCSDPGKITANTFTRPRGAAIKTAIEKAKSKKQKPDFGCFLSIKNTTTKAPNTATIQSQGFDCIDITNTVNGKLKIKRLCYISKRAKLDQAKKEADCVRNGKLFDPNQPLVVPPSGPVLGNNLFNPGCYYRITVETKTTGEINNDGDKGDAILNLYADLLEDIIDDVEKLTTNLAYFQTEYPPENITAYMKWSLPAAQQTNIYRADPLYIRFKREYIKALYGNPNLTDFRMQVFLKDTNGQLFPGTLSWMQAGAYTYFPDEQSWRNQLSNAGYSQSPKKDDILKVDFSSSDLYKPNSRYEMIITGAYDKNGTAENAEQRKLLLFGNRYYRILHSQTFETSRFVSVTQLLQGNNTGIKTSLAKGNVATFDTATSSNQKAWAEAEINLYITEIDYEYGVAKHSISSGTLVSKEAVEAKRVLLSKAKEEVDQGFRKAALAIQPDLAFAKSEQQSEIHLIETGSGSNARIEYVWLHLPESVRLKISGNGNRVIGKFKADIINKTNGSVIASSKIFNTDTSQIIFKLTTRVTPEVIIANYRLRVTNEADPADDTRTMIFENKDNGHHRYDRPAMKGQTTSNLDFGFYLV